MNKIWQIFKNQSLKGKSLIIWKLIMWVPVVISALIHAIMVAIFDLRVESGVDVFEEIIK